jgi:hypothetical protein
MKKTSVAFLAVFFFVLAGALGDLVSVARAQEMKEESQIKWEVGPDGLPYAPGGVRVGNKVFYEDGRVVLEFSPTDEDVVARQAGDGWKKCPSRWYCLFQHVDWNWNEAEGRYVGRMLRFSDPGRQDLDTYGFRDQTSSWVNKTSSRVAVVNIRRLRPDQRLWCSPPDSRSSWVGASDNDKADYVNIGGC